MGRPLLQQRPIRLDETLLGKLALLDREATALFPVVGDSGQRIIRLRQAWFEALTRSCVGVVNLRAVDFLERFHGADGADQLKIGVVIEQVAKKIKRQRCNTVRGHEIANLQAHLLQVLLGERGLIGLVFEAQHGVSIPGPVIGLVVGNAQANHRRLAEILLVGLRLHQALEDVAVQVAKVFRHAEVTLVLVVSQQQNTEVVVSEVRRKVIADNALYALLGFAVNDRRFEDLNGREPILLAVNAQIHIHRNDVQFDRIAVALRVIPVRQGIEAAINHRQGVAQVLSPALAPCQVGKIGRDPGGVGWTIVFIEAEAFDGEADRVIHGDLAT